MHDVTTLCVNVGYIPNDEYTTEGPYIENRPDGKPPPHFGPGEFEGSADDDFDDESSRSDEDEAELPIGPSDDEDFDNILRLEPGSGSNQ